MANIFLFVILVLALPVTFAFLPPSSSWKSIRHFHLSKNKNPTKIISTSLDIWNKNVVRKRGGSQLSMAFNTFVRVESNYEAKCATKTDPGVSLTDYMRLPVEQYVCLQMPLNATLERMANNQFNLTVPPVRFFHLDVSPVLICDVTQTADSVQIASKQCILRGSNYVVGLNGCYNINVVTKFQWTDTAEKRSIQSSSKIYVEVDPPKPFKYFGKTILESTGSLAMSIALRQIENAFVQSLAKDYERWANDAQYRQARANSGSSAGSLSHAHDFLDGSSPIKSKFSVDPEEVDVDNINDTVENDDRDTHEISSNSEISEKEMMKEGRSTLASTATSIAPITTVESSATAKLPTADTSLSIVASPSASPSSISTPSIVTTSATSTSTTTSSISVTTTPTSPSSTPSTRPNLSSTISAAIGASYQKSPALTSLTDDLCLLPGAEPEVRVEVAPKNSRRIYSGVDILANWDLVWQVLTDYENLGQIVPSLLQNDILERFTDGGARLFQVGGAKVLPGITFKAKTVLDVHLYDENNPIPESMLAAASVRPTTDEIDYNVDEKEKKIDFTKIPLRRDIFPRPYAITSLPHRDITMQNVLQSGGDFEHYQGIWRIQALPDCTYSLEGDSMSSENESELPTYPATRLSYAVEIKPRGFLPVNLIENRIAMDLKSNLDAIRQRVEALEAQKQRTKNQESTSEVSASSNTSDNGKRSMINGDDSSGAEVTSSTTYLPNATIENLVQENRRLAFKVQTLQMELQKSEKLLQDLRTLLIPVASQEPV